MMNETAVSALKEKLEQVRMFRKGKAAVIDRCLDDLTRHQQEFDAMSKEIADLVEALLPRDSA